LVCIGNTSDDGVIKLNVPVLLILVLITARNAFLRLEDLHEKIVMETMGMFLYD